MKWIDVNKEKPLIDEWVLVVIPNKIGGYFIPFTTQYHGGGKFRNEESDKDNYDEYSHLISHWCKLEYPKK